MKPLVFRQCPVCSSGETITFFKERQDSKQRFLNLSHAKYDNFMDDWIEALTLEVRKCGDCGHLWHYMQPDQESIFKMYDSRSSSNLSAGKHTAEPSGAMVKQMISLLKLLRYRSINSAKLLDYGSGKGIWSKAAVVAGFQVTAFEPSAERSSCLDENELIEKKYDIHELKGLKFDVINLEQVLEHIQDPIALMKSLKEYCYSHTVVRISVPNVERHYSESDQDWDGYPFNGQTMHIMSPYEHLQGFTPKSFLTAIKVAGYNYCHDLAMWKTHPLYMMRKWVGRLIPQISQTRAFLTYG